MLKYQKGSQKLTFNPFSDLDVGEAWTLDSDDELSCYGDEIASSITIDDEASAASTNDLVTLQVDRKSSTGSQVKQI